MSAIVIIVSFIIMFVGRGSSQASTVGLVGLIIGILMLFTPLLPLG